jgi:hypothetical protein
VVVIVIAVVVGRKEEDRVAGLRSVSILSRKGSSRRIAVPWSQSWLCRLSKESWRFVGDTGVHLYGAGAESSSPATNLNRIFKARRSRSSFAGKAVSCSYDL